MWLSKHGSQQAVGNAQYPNVSIADKQKFWAQIEHLFNDLLIDTTKSSINTTTLAELVARKHRMIIWATDWVEFTNRSPHALDGAMVDNVMDRSVDNEPHYIP